MLELGLRLASKKPTIVIVNSGGNIPFDIRDFEIIDYPSDTNILGMESFFSKLTRSLQEKYRTFESGDYLPFLGKIVVDVLSPQQREVTADQLVITKLDDLLSKLNRIEYRSSIGNSANHVGTDNIDIETGAGRILVSIPKERFEDAKESILETFESDAVRRRRISEGDIICEIVFSGASDIEEFRGRLGGILGQYGGHIGVRRTSF